MLEIKKSLDKKQAILTTKVKDKNKTELSS